MISTVRELYSALKDVLYTDKEDFSISVVSNDITKEIPVKDILVSTTEPKVLICID